jgi:hypothetical protein
MQPSLTRAVGGLQRQTNMDADVSVVWEDKGTHTGVVLNTVVSYVPQ